MTNILYLYIDSANGYGNSAKNLMSSLERIKGIEVDRVPLRPNIHREKELKEQYDIGIVHVSALSFVQDYQMKSFMTLSLSRCKKRYMYFLWETDRIPSFLDKFLTQTDFITGFICPSKFCASLVEKYRPGETWYIPITIDDIEYNIDKRTRLDKFTVLTIAQYSVRKAIDVSVCAFATAFAGHNDVQYYIKTGEKLEQGIEPDALIRANVQRSMITNPPSIFLIDRHLPEEQLQELYLKSDCMLHLSRGEGFAITPLTALNYGVHGIYTGWSAHCEYYEKDPMSIKIDGRLDLVHSMDVRHGFEPGMLWFEPNTNSAVDALREMYNRWKNKKLNYQQPPVIQEYRKEKVYDTLAKFAGLDTVELVGETKIDGISVVEL